MFEIFTQILGVVLIISGIYDGWKYHWLAIAIRKVGTAKGQSRKFVNAALAKDITIFLYMIVKFDLYILLMTLVGFIFTIELLITIYYFYPYRYRNLINFKRPSFLVYIVNSWLPNSLRKKL